MSSTFDAARRGTSYCWPEGPVRSLLFSALGLHWIGPIATLRRIWPCFERSRSIALPDRIHRFIPLVANGPRHYFDLRGDTETELSRGIRLFASSLLSQRRME